MEIQDILNYVMHTPANTNPNVLKSMLNELSNGSGELKKITLDGTLDNIFGRRDSTFGTELGQAMEEEKAIAIITIDFSFILPNTRFTTIMNAVYDESESAYYFNSSGAHGTSNGYTYTWQAYYCVWVNSGISLAISTYMNEQSSNITDEADQFPTKLTIYMINSAKETSPEE